MSYARSHTHACRNAAIGCTDRVECYAGRVDNTDGWPEVLCAAEADQQPHEGSPFVCEDCATGPSCEDCGRPAHLGHADGCEARQVAV